MPSINPILAAIVLVICLLSSGACFAQGSPQTTAAGGEAQSWPLPGWVVLVLQPLPGKRARPVTGVVVSGDGMIIVPMEFASPGDQVIVLDGGTDIIEHGRAASVVSTDAEAGLTLLSAPRLKRNPPSLPSNAPETGDTLHVAAFPPAELIAQGEHPVWRETRISGVSEDGRPVLAADALPPNLTAALLDSCGNLAGFSSSTGVQSMETSPQPRYLWKQGLARALAKTGVRLSERPCSASGPQATEQVADPVAEGQTGGSAGNPEATESQTANPEVAKGLPPGSAQPAVDKASELPWLVPLLAVLLLIFMTVTGCLLWRQRKPKPVSPESLLTADAPERLAHHHSGGIVPAPADSILRIQGRLADGTPFETECEVSSAAIDVVIGRGNADLVIDSPDVQRQHARLGGSLELMTLTDLGSARGSWINRVPCLKGEIMYISPDDLITLGDVSFRVLAPSGEGAGHETGAESARDGIKPGKP